MKRKKVLQISTTTLQYDGLTKVILNLSDYCNKDRYSVDLVLGKGAINDFLDIIIDKGIKYYVVPDRELNPIQYYIALFRILKSSGYDVVHIHGNSATMAIDLLIAQLCGVKVRIAHSHNTMTNHPLIHRLLQPILGFVTTVPVACGENAGLFLYKNNNFTIIPNCIKVDDFRFNKYTRELVRDELHYSNTDYVIGHVGRFRYQKNHAYIIDLFFKYSSDNDNAKLLLIGDEDGTNQLKNISITRVKELGITDKVVFLGSTSRVHDYLQAMDCFILPSHYEGLSITALEAQASGLPCLLSDQIATETMVTHNCWFLPLSQTCQEWIDKLEELQSTDIINREDSAKRMIEAGYDISNLEHTINTIWG